MKSSSDVHRYGLVIATCLFAILAGRISGAEATCLLLGIMVGSLYGGRYPSLLGVGISVLALDFFFLTPRQHFSIAPSAYPRFIAFTIAAFVIRYLIQSRENQIRKNAKELRELIDFIPHHVLLLDPDGHLLEANQMVLDYTGRTLDQMKNIETGERIRRDIHPDDIKTANGKRKRSLSEGLPFEIERRALGKDGEYRWFLFRYKPLVDDSGAISRWICTATDIENMKKEDERLRLVVDTTPAFIHSARQDGSIDYLNQRWLDYLGLSLESALDRRFEDSTKNIDPKTWAWNLVSTIHPEDLLLYSDQWNSIIRSCRSGEFEARIRRFDGQYRRFLFQVAPLCDKSGSVIKWYVSGTDIEDRRRAQEDLRQKDIEVANQLRLVIDTTPGLGWTAGPDGSADFLNRQWLEYSGLAIEEAIGWGFLVTIHPDDLPRMMEDVQRALKTCDFFESECRIRRHDGEYRRFLFRGTPVQDSEGNIVKWIGINTDIEDHRRVEDALRASEESLRLIIDGIPGLIHAMGPSGEVEIVSRQVMDFFGRSFEEFNDWPSLLHPDEHDFVLGIWQRSLETHEPVDIEHRVLRPDGTYTWVHSRGNPLTDPENRVIRWYYLITVIEGRRKAEEKLKRSEAYLLEAQRLSQTGSFGCKLSTREMIWSDETFRIFDYAPNINPTVEHILWRIHPEDRTLVSTYVDRAMRDGVDCDFECRLLLPDESVKHLHLVAHAIRDESGSTEFLGAVIDITERKRVHEALRRSESYLLEGQRLTHTGSFGWSVPEKNPTYLSEECLHIFGFDPKKGMPTWEDRLQRVHPEDQAQWQEKIERAIQEKSGYEVDYRIILPCATLKHIHVVGHPVLSEAGDLVEFIGTAMDVTERWKTEEALRENEYHLRLIIEAIPALIWCALPIDGKVIYANQRFCNYAGRTLDELLECKWSSLIHPDDTETTSRSWRHALKTGEPHEITHRLRRGDGEYRWFQTLAEPLRDRDNRITRWYGLNIEIDESKKMAEALRFTQAKLTRATQIATVAELSASIAHEINQPLAAVVANADACEMWLSTDPPNLERARQAIQRIIRDGNASAAVIQRIRALFRAETANKVALDMNEVIQEVLHLVSNELQRKRVSVQLELSPELPATLADRVQMQQLMINLVNNGIEAMDGMTNRSKKLLLSSKSDDSSILIEVCDHGSGLVDLERAFEPFFTTKDKGMGIGLSICRSIVEAHEGNIWITRNKDQGTTFSFRLPVFAEGLE
jgi:PAS domain S-box-containing protein